MNAIGLEMSVDTDLAAAVLVLPRDDLGRGYFHLRVLHYGATDDVVAKVAGVEVWCDQLAVAGLLPSLRRAGTFPHFLEAVDVAAASFEFKAAVRARMVTADPHEGLREAMMYAARRPLAAAFAFERRRVASDQSLVNASAFGMWAAKAPPAQIF